MKFRFVSFLFAAVSLCGCVSENNKSQEQSRSVAQSPTNYCIALRGNGEAEPAHWGALAQTVEKLGMPSAMAGGSSATISIFLMESIAANRATRSQASENLAEAFMLKSLVGFFAELKKTEMWTDINKIYGAYKESSEAGWLPSLEKAIADGDFATATKLYQSAALRSSIDPTTAAVLKRAISTKNLAQAKFLISELRDTIKVFGKFNADDENLFFREGLVNFDNAADLFGKIGGFYSSESSSLLEGEWHSLLKNCSPNTEGMLWQEIVSKRPECAKDFAKMFQTYFASSASSVKPEDKMIGRQFQVFATTAVLTGNAEKEFAAARAKYFVKLDSHFGKDFKPSNSEEIRFGYWGPSAKLKEIQSKLNPVDEKARRFIALGPATWKQVLSISPAEPGLSPFKEFKNFSGQSFVSAGGWSDLHPVDVLKASGCSNVIYITRKGDESSFAQGLARRLGLDTTKLYDLDNPQSSFTRNIKHSNSVVCTNWNDFDVKTQAAELIADSYHAPMLLSGSTKESVRGCSLKIVE